MNKNKNKNKTNQISKENNLVLILETIIPGNGAKNLMREI